MHQLVVKNLGPINNCEVRINDFVLFIGPQSSGKSTISKLIFFFLGMRDEVVDFLLDQAYQNEKEFKFNVFTKQVRRKFVEFWGPTPQHRDLYIRYQYNKDTWVEVALDQQHHKYVTPRFSQNIIDNIYSTFEELKNLQVESKSAHSLFSTANVISFERSRSEIIKNLKDKYGAFFDFNKELLFIPAGRSLLSTLSDQLQYIHPHQLDYPMRQFIERINSTKSFFGKPLDDLIKDKKILYGSNVWDTSIRKTKKIISRILKGEYIHDKEGGKLYVGNGRYTKINFSSSGQQESIWILLSLFLVVLDKVDACIFIEEPEAHLFPCAQKDMVELVSFIYNVLKAQFIITTHSPYILSAMNNHIYAFIVGCKQPTKIAEIIEKDEWLNIDKISGYFVKDGQINSLIDKDLSMLRTELIDSASDDVNKEYDAMFTLHQEAGIDA